MQTDGDDILGFHSSYDWYYGFMGNDIV